MAHFPPPPAEPRAVHLLSFNGLHELVPSRTGWLEVLFRGRPISPPVGSPAGIAFSNGHLYICDPAAGAVHDWDLAEGYVAWIGTGGEGRLTAPVAVAIAESGDVFVADTGRGAVLKFSSDGAFLQGLRRPEAEAYKPAAVAVHGGKVFVADMAGHAVDVYSIRDGTHLRTIGGPGGGPGQFFYPTGVAVSGGAVFVSELIGARVQVFDADGKATTTFGRPGDRYGEMGKPKHLAVGPDGIVFIADAGFDRVHLFDADGRLLMLLGGAGAMPFGVAVAESLPETIAELVPTDFLAAYYVFVANGLGEKRIALYAIGQRK